MVNAHMIRCSTVGRPKVDESEVREISLGEYRQFVPHASNAMFNHSGKYIEFLSSLLKDSSLTIFGQFDAQDLVAACPFFVQEGSFGKVVNSLPYFGSHGGVISLKDVGAERLGNYVQDFFASPQFDSTTIVEPLDNRKFLKSPKVADEALVTLRIGQVTPLPRDFGESGVREAIFSTVSKNVRNMIRKAESQGIEVCIENTEQGFMELLDLHEENMRRLGGVSKSGQALGIIQRIFEPSTDYNLYVARLDGQVISALLLFYWGDYVEYWIPAIRTSFRQLQPNSLLIFRAMTDVVSERSERLWNWGGTWKEQHGVFRFKQQWGAESIDYRYLTTLKAESDISSTPLHSLIDEYPGFFVRPKFPDVDEVLN